MSWSHKRILIGYDEFPCSRRALGFARKPSVGQDEVILATVAGAR
jgi:hypothetical protein